MTHLRLSDFAQRSGRCFGYNFDSNSNEPEDIVQNTESRLSKIVPEAKQVYVWLREIRDDVYYHYVAGHKVYLNDVEETRRELLLKSFKTNSIELKYHTTMRKHTDYEKVGTVVKPIMGKVKPLAFIEIGWIPDYSIDEQKLFYIESISAVLKNKVYMMIKQQEISGNQYESRMIVKAGFKLIEARSLHALSTAISEVLFDIFNSQCTRVLFINKDSHKFIYFVGNKCKEDDICSGLAGESLKLDHMSIVKSPMDSPTFNGNVDLDTSLPLVSIPVLWRHAKLEFGTSTSYSDIEPLGVIQIGISMVELDSFKKGMLKHIQTLVAKALKSKDWPIFK